MTTHRALRNTHLLLGLFCCLWLLMYGVSSLQMAHNRWFVLRPEVTIAHLPLPPGADGARAVARELMDAHIVRGEVTQVRTVDTTLAFTVVRPGTVYQVEYAPATGGTIVRESRAGFMGMLNRLHHVGGVAHGYWLINAWGVFTGIVSASLVGIGLTGIYWWFQMHRERKIGGVLLAVSLTWSVTLMIALRSLR